MSPDQISPARLLAPIALVAAFIAVIVVIAAGGGSGDSGKKSTGGNNNGGQTKTQRQRKRYIVKQGDSLSIIAEKTGVPVDRLTQLNPDVDPQALISGTCVALRTSSDCK